VTGVLLAVPELAQEPALVAGAAGAGLRILRRCVDAVDLLAAAAADPAAAVVVSPGLPRLTRDVLDRIRSTPGRPVVGLAGEPESGRLVDLGVGRVVTPGPSAEATLRALAAALDEGTDGRPPARGVWETGCWDAPPDVGGASHASPEASGRIVVVWGPMGAPGRTTVATGCAEALSERGLRVCLVDADTYAPSVLMGLGIVEEASGLVVACRQADNGTLTDAALQAATRRVRPGWHVLGGLPRAERWADLRPGALDRVWASCRSAFDVTVVDIGFCLERDESTGAWARERNAAALTALAAADHVLAVADASAAGAARLAASWPALAPWLAGGATVVRNRSHGAGRDWLDALRWAGIAAPVHSVPSDPRTLAACWERGRSLGEGARRSRIRRAMAQVAGLAVPA
jgi:Mrp family chromosome partitioning ATPase